MQVKTIRLINVTFNFAQAEFYLYGVLSISALFRIIVVLVNLLGNSVG